MPDEFTREIAGHACAGADHFWLTPNRVTLLRVLLAMAAVALYATAGRARALEVGCAAIALTLAAVSLDGLDGFLARRMHLCTPLGAQLDILGDRIIENLFFTCFAVTGQVSLWVPLTFCARGLLTDFLRGLAAVRQQHHLAEASTEAHWFLESSLARAIVASRASRLAYGALKCASFCALGLEWTLERAPLSVSSSAAHLLHQASRTLVVTAVAYCLLRSLPVIWEGRRDVLRSLRVPGRDHGAGEDASVSSRGSAGHSAREPLLGALPAVRQRVGVR